MRDDKHGSLDVSQEARVDGSKVLVRWVAVEDGGRKRKQRSSKELATVHKQANAHWRIQMDRCRKSSGLTGCRECAFDCVTLASADESWYILLLFLSESVCTIVYCNTKSATDTSLQFCETHDHNCRTNGDIVRVIDGQNAINCEVAFKFRGVGWYKGTVVDHVSDQDKYKVYALLCDD